MPEGNVLYYGDNLEILRRYVEDESVDLVYLDPPFNSNQDFNVLFQERNGTSAAAQVKAFEDTWSWDQSSASAFHDIVQGGGRVADAMVAFERLLGHNDMLAYLSMMSPRLVELHRVLKLTGSIYLHCDPTASHYLKVLLDAVFEPENFQGEVIWRRTASHVTTRRWPRLHDVLLSYARDVNQVKFNPPRTEQDPGWIEREYRFQDERGRYMVDNLTGAGTTQGPSGKPWRGIDPAKIGSGRHWRHSPETLDRLDAEGRIYWPKKGQYPKLKQYLHETKGTAVGDLWTDIQVIGRTASERLGYPTQKPELLVERIVQAATNEGDLVLDPFCGCGTAIAVAQRLNRKWIGIDITQLAVALIRHRLKTAFGDSVSLQVIGEPRSLPDAKALAEQDPYQFQWWALSLIPARPAEQKKGADKGIDGRIYFFSDRTMKGKPEQIVFSVNSGTVVPGFVRDLRGVVEREKAAIGVLITLNPPTAGMREEAASGGFYTSPELGRVKYPRIQILTVEELLNGKKVACPPFAVGQGNVTFRRAPEARVEDKSKTKGSTIHEFQSSDEYDDSEW